MDQLDGEKKFDFKLKNNKAKLFFIIHTIPLSMLLFPGSNQSVNNGQFKEFSGEYSEEHSAGCGNTSSADSNGTLVIDAMQVLY